MLADTNFGVFYQKTLWFGEIRLQDTTNRYSRLRRENSSEMTFLPLRWRSMSLTLMNTHRWDPRADDDAADEEDDDVEEDEDEWDEAVTGGAASPCVPLVASAVGPGPRSGVGTSALISLSRGDTLQSGDSARTRSGA